MDLALYARVLGRHKLVLLVGLALAVLLGVFASYRVHADGFLPSLEPRKAEVWQSRANILLTESGFPAGRLSRYNDPGRLAGLAIFYSRLATSDEVQQRIVKQGRPFGQFSASPTVETTSAIQATLPIVALYATASTAGGAKVTVERGLNAFLSYVSERQQGAGIPKSQRVQLRVLNAPQPPVLLVPRKKTLPIVVFLAVLISAVALTFILENVSRARQPVEAFVEGPIEVVAEAPVETVAASLADENPRLQPEAEPEPEPEVSVRRWA